MLTTPEPAAARPRVRFDDLPAIVGPALGIPLPTVATYARELRYDGIIPVGGRGRAFLGMTAREVASLVVAILGTGRPTQACEAHREFAGLHCVSPLPIDDGDEELVDVAHAVPETWPAAAAIATTPGHKLDTMIAALIEDLASDLSPALDFLEVRAHGPSPCVEVGLSREGERRARVPDHVGAWLSECSPVATYRPASATGGAETGIVTERAITLAALAAIGRQL